MLEIYRKSGGEAYFSHYNSRARGVAILFKRGLKIHDHCLAPDGRYLIIDASIAENRFTLLNMYAPNKDSPDIFASHGLCGSFYE